MPRVVKVPELLEGTRNDTLFRVDDQTATLVGNMVPKLRRVLRTLGVVEDGEPARGVRSRLHHQGFNLGVEFSFGEEVVEVHSMGRRKQKSESQRTRRKR